MKEKIQDLIKSRNNLLCIWYPSGGFGHFVSAILTLHGRNFAKANVPLVFSPKGDSHAFPCLLPKYFHNPKHYQIPDTDPGLIYTVLIDNGINDESTLYRKHFPGSKTLKLCYSDHSWCIVARTMVEKALGRDLEDEISLDDSQWPSDENWAVREKYFLYLRDHPLRFSWRPSDDCHSVLLEQLVAYEDMRSCLADYGLDPFYDDWQRWKTHNQTYVSPMETALDILKNIKNKQSIDLDIADLWTQSVVNYFIWLEYQFEVPANDYADWFTNTKQIVTMLEQHGAVI